MENDTIFQFEQDKDFADDINNTIDFNFHDNTYAVGAATQAALNGMTVAQFDGARAQILAWEIENGPWKFQGYSLGCPAGVFGSEFPSVVPGPNYAALRPACSPGNGGGGKINNYTFENKTTWWLTDNWRLKNIFGHIWGYTINGADDIDKTTLILLDQDPRAAGVRINYPTTWSDELQAIGKIDQPSLVGGLFAYKQFLHQGARSRPCLSLPRTCRARQTSPTTTKGAVRVICRATTISRTSSRAWR